MDAFPFEIVFGDALPVCDVSEMEEGEGVVWTDIEIGPPLHPLAIRVLDIKDTEF